MHDLEAPITHVTVYADRALVTRRGTLHLTAGDQEIRVNQLPRFIRESLRAAGQGPQGTRILNVEITTAYHSRPPEAELQALQNELEQLQQQQQLLKARQDALNDRRKWLRSLGEQSHDFAKGLAQGQMSSQDCADFFSFMAQQSQQDAEAAQSLEREQNVRAEEISAKQRELAHKQGYGNPDRLAACVSVAVAEEGDFTLELSYLITGASWHPQYDIRVQMERATNSGSVELTYSGMIQQTTGESWTAADLSLSTARPSLAAILPELHPWYLNVYTPPIMYAASVPAPAAPAPQAVMHMRASSKRAALPFGGAADEAPTAPEPVEAEIATASVEQTGTAYVFHVGRSVDIPSDNSPHKTTIARDNLPCEFDYVTAPALEAQTHLRATITNSTERVLLKGNASIFLDGEYVGTTEVKQSAPTEHFKVFLGIDDSIKVKREPTERAVDKGNLLQNDLRRSTYAYQITLHNYSPVARKVSVRDHLPVSQHERIKVRLLSIQPQPVERTKLELLKWNFTLPPNSEQRIEYRFVVEHPQSLSVTGLPSTSS